MSSSKWYHQWRRSEAYMLPMTKEGQEAASERMRQFKVGWKYGMKAAISHLEQMHKANKDTHKFYLFAKQELEDILMRNLQDIE